MKDRQITEVINTIRDIANEYHDTQQLRERIAAVLRPVLMFDAKKSGQLIVGDAYDKGLWSRRNGPKRRR